MKLKTIILAAISILAISSCKKDEAPAYLEVNRNNISGSWELSTWTG